MKKGAFFAIAAVLAAGAAVYLLTKRDESAEQAAPAAQPAASFDPDKTVAFPLKNKYADFSRGENYPIYRFELDTPGGVKEVVVSAEQYDTCYIGDEVVCVETGRGLEVV